MTPQEMSRKFDCTRQGVMVILHKYKIELRPRGGQRKFDTIRRVSISGMPDSRFDHESAVEEAARDAQEQIKDMVNRIE